MSRSVAEIVAPTRLGTSFRWLLGSSWVSNIGDGVMIAAGPLLVASETRDPLLVALAAVLQYLPWLVFGLFAGVVADRVDRRRLVAVAEPVPGRRARRPRRHDRHRRGQHRGRAGRDLPARHRRDLRRHHDRHAAADARGQARPRHRQRPADRRHGDAQPARRPADRGAAVRPRALAAVRRPRRSASALSVVLVLRLRLPAHGRERTGDAPPRSAATSSRACAGCGATPPCARWR